MTAETSAGTPRILCIGGANRDEVLRLAGPLAMGASNPVTTRVTPGGVARNVAGNLVALHCRAALLAVVGDDAPGGWLLEATAAGGVDTGPSISRAGAATGRYVAVLDAGGDLIVGLADMAATESLGPADIAAAAAAFGSADAVFADANLLPGTLAAIRAATRARGVPLTLDLVSPEKARRLGTAALGADIVAGNRDEAGALLGQAGSLAALATALVAGGAGAAVVSGGTEGLGWCDGRMSGALPASPARVVDVTGAGDALVAGLLAARLGGGGFEAACRAGLDAAAAVVEAEGHALPCRMNAGQETE
jgi:pseudouridine kinase